ncbi:MAG: hypothetical protein ACLFWL_11845 [Candidatus Brocadiia bacterium]
MDSESIRKNLRPEYSAQAMGFAPNPMVSRAIEVSKEETTDPDRIADQGCGKLRHLRLFMSNYTEIFLVETQRQLRRRITLNGQKQTIPEYLHTLPSSQQDRIEVVSSAEFSDCTMNLDAIFSICVYDVVRQSTRQRLANAARRNLRPGGLYVVIAPRNDSSILKRCSKENEFEDGHYFQHHGIVTFYRNFRRHELIVDMVQSYGFKLLTDMSRYRQVCMVFVRE